MYHDLEVYRCLVCTRVVRSSQSMLMLRKGTCSEDCRKRLGKSHVAATVEKPSKKARPTSNKVVDVLLMRLW